MGGGWGVKEGKEAQKTVKTARERAGETQIKKHRSLNRMERIGAGASPGFDPLPRAALRRRTPDPHPAEDAEDTRFVPARGLGRIPGCSHVSLHPLPHRVCGPWPSSWHSVHVLSPQASM